jgi:tetratricopeptide (TPR) repeat protein
VKARHRPVLLACGWIATSLAAAPLVAQQSLSRTPDPTTPRIMVPVLRSSEKGLGLQAQQSIMSRIQQDFPFKVLWVISKNDICATLEASGYPCDQPLAPMDAKNLGQLLRADEFVQGSVSKTSVGFRYEMRLVLVRDISLVQPLEPVEGANLTVTSGLFTRELQAARQQLEGEQKCVAAGRQGKFGDAVAAAREGIKTFPKATIARVCLAQSMVSLKAPPDSIIAVTSEILAVDPSDRTALSLSGQAYADKKKIAIDERTAALAAMDTVKLAAAGRLVNEYEQQAIERWTRLISLDPTNTREVDEVVRQIAASANPRVAKPIIDTVVAQNPGDPQLLHLQWLIDLAVRDWKAAIGTGEAMVKLDTALADTNYFTRMVAAYDADSQPQKAVEVVSRGVERFPANCGLGMLLAQMQRRAGQTQQAVASTYKVIKACPKDPLPYRQLIQAYIELNQPDSAMLAIRQSAAAGDSAAFLANYSLSEGNKWYKRGAAAKGNADSTTARDIFAMAMRYLTLSDSLTATPTAKFLLGVSAFQIAISALQEASKSKSCDLAKVGQQNFTIAQINLPSGGSVDPGTTGQLLGLITQYSPTADNYVKNFCK